MIRDLIKVIQKRIKRLPLHHAIRGLVSWEPQAETSSGYTVVIGCMRALAPLAVANIHAIERMDATGMEEVLLVFDCTEAELPESVRKAASDWKGTPGLRIICYEDHQARVARRVDWGWVYSWMSWCKGIAAARTRHVLLHDLDALALDPKLFRRLYEQALTSGAQFQGIRNYDGQGIDPSMNLVTTFEMVLDAQYVRETFRPFDAFNHVRLLHGRYVDFDTFLHMQHRSKIRTTAAVDESCLVHPSQMICQYTDLVSGRDAMHKKRHNLLLLPYYFLVGGEETSFDAIGSTVGDPEAAAVEFAQRALPIGHLVPDHWAWMEKQIRRVEQTLFGRTRPKVEAYLKGFVERAGDRRTVGREGSSGVADR